MEGWKGMYHLAWMLMGWHAFRSCDSKKDGTFHRNDDWRPNLLSLKPMSRKGSQIMRIETVSCHIPADPSHAAKRLSTPMATLQSEICICVSRIKQAYKCHFPLFFSFCLFSFLTLISQSRWKAHGVNFPFFFPLPKKLPKLAQAFVSTSVTIFTEGGWISC